jgi:putative FmdB family regulatory protein
MPIYEYTRQKCGNEFELLVRDSQPPVWSACGTTGLEKRFSVSAAHTKSGKSLAIYERPHGGDCGLPQCARDDCGI